MLSHEETEMFDIFLKHKWIKKIPPLKAFIMSRGFAKFKECVKDKSIFNMASDLFFMAISGWIEDDRIDANKRGIFKIKVNDDYYVIYIMNENKFNVINMHILFEIEENVELHGKRKSIWEEVEPKLRNIFIELYCKYISYNFYLEEGSS